eukprot:COSAG04_NODE_14131_length_579_cov_1.250000_2_plen_79_part_01
MAHPNSAAAGAHAAAARAIPIRLLRTAETTQKLVSSDAKTMTSRQESPGKSADRHRQARVSTGDSGDRNDDFDRQCDAI